MLRDPQSENLARNLESGRGSLLRTKPIQPCVAKFRLQPFSFIIRAADQSYIAGFFTVRPIIPTLTFAITESIPKMRPSSVTGCWFSALQAEAGQR
jgi:hypothetical protein